MISLLNTACIYFDCVAQHWIEHIIVGCKCCGFVMRVWTSKARWNEIRNHPSKGILDLLAVTVDCSLARFDNVSENEVA